ncbi:hypothetical protein [Aquirufa salirivi]|uniref:Lrp/AsnC family transcriptional regulator n=1 Tax=Aquirufa salirivi TaxID=3104729 RepID=A0ABW8RVY7_9BACT
MRKHNGMRPQDVAILLKIISMNSENWQLVELANLLSISISEISESLNRSRLAGLIDYNKKKINRQNLLEFLEYGVRYVFPQHPGPIVRGILTAHSHPEIKKIFVSEMNYVWPDSKGDAMGQMIEPFYKKQVEAVKVDKEYYRLLALVDIIRVGKVREIKYAIKELKNDILHESSVEYGKN